MKHRSLPVLVAVALQLATGAALASQDPDEGTYDDQLAKIAKRVPAYCGSWVDEEAGELRICLTDDGQSLDAAWAAELEMFKDDPEELAGLTPVAVRGRYGWLELMDWYYAMTGSGVHSVASISFTDIDEVLNRIYIGVLDIADEPKVRAALESVGIPAEAVVVGQEDPVFMQPHIEEMPTTTVALPSEAPDPRKAWPLAIGVIAPLGILTLAFWLRRRRRSVPEPVGGG